MEDGKESDLRIPIVFTIFSLCLIAGGIFLVFYVFFPDLSKPWYLTAALVLIGCPWLFWLLTYVYTCLKRCLRGGANTVDHQVSRRQSTREPEMPLTHSV